MRRAAPLRSRVGAGLIAGVALLATAGCSAQKSSTSVTAKGTTLTIYASQPPGAVSQTTTDLLDAERLALRQDGAKVGKFTLRLATIHGSKLSDDAREAIQDQSAIAYLGELVPGTSPITVEITNELDLLQVSPADTAPYLTQATAGMGNTPTKYYPSNSTYHETFARVVPTTIQEASAIVGQMQARHLSSLYVSDDSQAYGVAIAQEIRTDAHKNGISLAAGPSSAQAVFYGSNSVSTATAALGRVASVNPSATLFVPSALYQSAFVSGLSAAAQKHLVVSSPGFATRSLTASGRQFVQTFQSAYGHAPVPGAIFGYEAMSAVLAVLRESGANANNRSLVVAEFRALKNRQSVLGTYSIEHGDTTLAPFVFATVKGGQLVVSGG